MVDMVRLQNLTREFLEVEVLFVGGVIRSDHAKAATGPQVLIKFRRDSRQRFRPRDFFELSVPSHKRRLQTLRMIVKIECVAALNAQEFAVDSRAISIVSANDMVVARSERGFAAVP